MARSRSGGFWNKALELIGLVDEPRDDEELPRSQRRDRWSDEPDDASRDRRSYRRAEEEPLSSSQGRRAYERERASSSDRSRTGRQAGSYSTGDRYTDDSARRSRDDDTRRRAEEPRRTRRAEEEPARDRRTNPLRRQPNETRRAEPRQSRPVSRQSRASATTVYTLVEFADCREVIKLLIGGNTIVLTMQHIDETTARRVLDTLSGAVFALGASVRKASDSTYLLTPSGIDVNESKDLFDDEEEF